jgi:hypothetical protein
MFGRKNPLPDIDPTIAQAEAAAPAPLAAPAKSALCCILAMALLGALTVDWSRISKLGRSQLADISAATETVGSR